MTEDNEIPETSIEEVKDQIVSEETSDNLEDAAKQDIANIDNQLRIFLQKVGLETITLALEHRSKTLGQDEFKARVETPGSYEYILALAAQDYSDEADRVLKSIEQIEDKSLFDSKYVRDGKAILSSILSPRSKSFQGKSLSGNEARVQFAIKSGQAKRVALYNSGFYLDIEAPTLTALNNFFTKTHSETTQYGREFGANFFYFNDLLIKEAIVELILPLVMSSSLKNWNRNDNLIRNIKLNDLKVILNAIAALMFPDGFMFTHVCTNAIGGCNYKEDMLIDITKLFRHDFMKLKNEHIEHMTRYDEVTYEKISNYQELLGFNKFLRYDNMEFELRVPSLDNYLTYGRKFNSDLLKSNFAENTADIYQSLIFCYYQVYTPFIQSVTLYDEDNNKDVMSSDPEVISHQLSRLQQNDPEQKFISDIDKYIASTEITHICYPAHACPKCKHIPADTGYYAVDPEHTFFILVLKKLTPN